MNLITHEIKAEFFAETRRTAVVWLGMAGALVQSRGTVLLIDPLLTARLENDKLVSEVGYALNLPWPILAEQLPRADLVMYTHADDDHFGSETARTLAHKTACRFIAPPPVARKLFEAGLPHHRIMLAREGQEHAAGDTRILITPALHDWQAENPWRREDCCGYLLRTPDGAVWHPGDTRWIDDLLQVKGVDVLFFDVAAVDSHLGPQGSARLAASCGAKVLLPYHYGTFDLPPGSFGNCDPQDSLPHIQGLDATWAQLNPGEPLWLGADA